MIFILYFILFYVMLISFSRYLRFCPDSFGHVGKRFDKNAKTIWFDKVISKQGSQTGKQMIEISEGVRAIRQWRLVS